MPSQDEVAQQLDLAPTQLDRRIPTLGETGEPVLGRAGVQSGQAAGEQVGQPVLTRPDGDVGVGPGGLAAPRVHRPGLMFQRHDAVLDVGEPGQVEHPDPDPDPDPDPTPTRTRTRPAPPRP